MVTVPEKPVAHWANPAMTVTWIAMSAAQTPLLKLMHQVVVLVISTLVGMVL
jgi:hypothetical protein